MKQATCQRAVKSRSPPAGPRLQPRAQSLGAGYRGCAVLPPPPEAPLHPRAPPEPDDPDELDPEPDELDDPDELDEPDEREPAERDDPDELDESDELEPAELDEPDEPPDVDRDRAEPTMGAGCGTVPVISGLLLPVVPGPAGDPPRV